MTKGTKVVLIIAVVCIALSVLLFGVGAMLGGTRLADGVETNLFGVSVHIGKDGFYAGGTDVETTSEYTADEKITAIDVNWTSGAVNVVIGGDVITAAETCKGTIDERNQMICTVENGTLRVKYRADRIGIADLGETQVKNLTITIPEHLVPEIKNIQIDTTSADVSIGGFESENLKIHVTSGDAFVTDVAAGAFVFEATSGELTMERCALGSFSADTTSGDVSVTEVTSGYAGFELSSGDVTAENCSFGKVEAESTSGNISMSLNSVPSEFDADTTSGNVEIFLPEDAEFTLEFDHTSGRLELDFAAVMREDEYIVGGGKNEINIETTSGDARIRVK